MLVMLILHFESLCKMQNQFFLKNPLLTKITNAPEAFRAHSIKRLEVRMWRWECGLQQTTYLPNFQAWITDQNKKAGLLPTGFWNFHLRWSVVHTKLVSPDVLLFVSIISTEFDYVLVTTYIASLFQAIMYRSQACELCFWMESMNISLLWELRPALRKWHMSQFY